MNRASTYSKPFQGLKRGEQFSSGGRLQYRFNLLKTLSGIETIKRFLLGLVALASTYSKPFQGLKQLPAAGGEQCPLLQLSLSAVGDWFRSEATLLESIRQG